MSWNPSSLSHRACWVSARRPLLCCSRWLGAVLTAVLVLLTVAAEAQVVLNEGWPAGTSGTGLSLQRRTLQVYGNDPINWFAAAPTAGTVILPPQLLGVSWRADVGAEVSLGYGTAPAFELLASTNLVDWTLIARFTNYASPGVATDPAAIRTPARFYRGRVVAQ